MRKKVSVILPVYNMENYLEDCIDSVLSSSYQNLEIIAVDDGSTDNTSAMLDELAERDKRLSVIHTDNQGVSSARNRGIQESSGEYVTFVDADDLIDHQMLEKMIDAMESSDSDIAVCTRRRFSNGQQYETLNLSGRKMVFQIIDLKIDSMHTVYDWSVTWGKIYRRELLQGIAFSPNIKYGEDLFFAADVWSKAERAVYLDEAFYGYRYNEESASFTLGERKIKDRIVASMHAWEWIYPNCPKSRGAMFDLCFGAFVAGYSELSGGEKERVFKEYCTYYNRYPEIRKNRKAFLFRYTPDVFVTLQRLKQSV